MPHKHLFIQSAAREKILHGALALADALRATLTEVPEPKAETLQPAEMV